MAETPNIEMGGLEALHRPIDNKFTFRPLVSTSVHSQALTFPLTKPRRWPNGIRIGLYATSRFERRREPLWNGLRDRSLDGGFAAQAFEDDADLDFGGILIMGDALDIADERLLMDHINC